MPAALPMSRTRTQNFDDLALEAVEAVEQTVADAERLDAGNLLRDVEFAVEDVPADVSAYDTDVLEDRDVPLARLMPGQPGTKGRNPRIVIYRRPLELRAQGSEELAQMLRDVVVEQVANLLGVRPEDIDPDS
ncbi:MAG: metallopeptidase family protein [Stackebrandtia sp.]